MSCEQAEIESHFRATAQADGRGAEDVTSTARNWPRAAPLVAPLALGVNLERLSSSFFGDLLAEVEC